MLGMTNRLFVQRGSSEGAPAPPEPAYQWIPDWDSENAYEIDMWINVFSGCQCTKHDVLFEGLVSGWYLVGDGMARNRMMCYYLEFKVMVQYYCVVLLYHLKFLYHLQIMPFKENFINTCLIY